MPKKARTYTAEFKARAVRLCESSSKPISEIARDLGLKYQTLYQWMRDAGKTVAAQNQDREEALPGETVQEEVRRLRRELAEAKMQRDFLKKALAFFARDEK